VIPSQTVGDTRTFVGCQTVTAEAPFVVGPTGDVTLQAGAAVILGPGFRVEAGGALTVGVDPALAGGG
jgi:hypothetical protein